MGTKRKLSGDQIREAKKLRRRGLTLAQIGARFGCSWITVYRVLPDSGHRRRRTGYRTWDPGPGRLKLEEREEIGRGLVAGESLSAIAARLARNVSTISREVAANGGRKHYRGCRAHQRAFERARRPKAAKLDDPAEATSRCIRALNTGTQKSRPSFLRRHIQRAYAPNRGHGLPHTVPLVPAAMPPAHPGPGR